MEDAHTQAHNAAMNSAHSSMMSHHTMGHHQHHFSQFSTTDNNNYYGRGILPYNGFAQPKDVIYSLQMTGADSQFGCPGCHGGSVSCNINKNFLPNELDGKLTKEEFFSFTSEIDSVLEWFHWPILPCMIAHFIIPFSPICAKAYCEGARQRNIQKAIDRANEKILYRGYYWETSGGLSMMRFGLNLGGIATLKVNNTAHQQYLATLTNQQQPNTTASTGTADGQQYANVVVATAPAVEMQMVRGTDDKHGAYASVVEAEVIGYETV